MKCQRTRGFTLLELVAVLVIIAIAAALILPTLQGHGCGARRTSCASNLNQIAKAMYMYSDLPSNGGCFPTLATGKDPYATDDPMGAVSLLYKSYIMDPRIFSCPNKPVAPSELQKIAPTVDGKLPPPADRLTPARCSYGYDPGHGVADALAAIGADKKGAGKNSDNHGPNAGQNIFIGAGTVEFHDSPANQLENDASGKPMTDDDIFGLNATIPRAMDGYIRQ